MKIPKLARGERLTITKNGTTAKTVETIQAVSEYAAKNDPYLHYLAAKFKNKPDTLLLIFRFCYLSSKFERDKPDLQTVRTPQAVRNGGVANCVDYTVFISALLRILEIPHKIRIVSFAPFQGFSHVYIITDGGIVLDPVFGKDFKNDEKNINRYYNKEVPYLLKKDFQVWKFK
jgi:hypothetical protein